MIYSTNREPSIEAFAKLMFNTDAILNFTGDADYSYYSKRNNAQLEEDVIKAMRRAAIGTPFENTIDGTPEFAFPDIVAGGFYGVEVKSTKDNKWKSIGSSILESTRIDGIERIYLTFGKLGKPIEFRSRPYEECLYGISVTHYPRYQIDMELKKGDTIFDKIGIVYDDFRKLKNPVIPVAEYYKSQLREGQSLWWAPDVDLEEDYTPATITMWTYLTRNQKKEMQVVGCAFFPEVIKSKYDRFSTWLITRKSILCNNVRDAFSAGGQRKIITRNGVFEHLPAVYGRIYDDAEIIKEIIENAQENELKEHWNVDYIEDDRLSQWINLVAANEVDRLGVSYSKDVLHSIFET